MENVFQFLSFVYNRKRLTNVPVILVSMEPPVQTVSMTTTVTVQRDGQARTVTSKSTTVQLPLTSVRVGNVST